MTMIDILFLIVSLLINRKIIYIYFIYLIIKSFKAEKKFDLSFFLNTAIYSVILPDNYLPIMFWALYFLVSIITNKGYKINKKPYYVVLILFIILIVASTIINAVPIINVLVATFTLSPFLMFLWLAGNSGKTRDAVDIYGIELVIDKVLYIQIFATIINLFTRFRQTIDWSIGTFDEAGGEQAQLAVIMSLFGVFYLYKFRQNRENYFSLYKLIACVLIVFSTSSFLLVLMLAVGVCVTAISSLNKEKIAWLNRKTFAKITAKTRRRAIAKRCGIIVLALLVVVGSVSLAFVVLPESVTGPVKLMFTDENYLDYRFHKIMVYNETFFEIPGKDLKFALIGNGLGNYNSRGALICTGQYVDLYNKFFEPSISEYTQEYVMDYLSFAYHGVTADHESVLARPYASLMALMGELGYLGIIVFILLVVFLCEKKCLEAKMLVFVWLSFCFAESYFEYPKVIIVLYSVMFLMEKPLTENPLVKRKIK